jgi:hypothetical protein
MGQPDLPAEIHFAPVYSLMNQRCQIEYVSSGSAEGMLCGKPAVAECADCGVSVCSACRLECCGSSFCEYCYDYHATHSCVKKPVQHEQHPLRLILGSHDKTG